MNQVTYYITKAQFTIINENEMLDLFYNILSCENPRLSKQHKISVIQIKKYRKALMKKKLLRAY